MIQYVGVVLAGGLSSRMGTDKSQLKWQGETLLQHSYKVLASSYCHYIYISHNRGEGIQDRFTECGPLSGIDAVIQQVRSGEWLTILPVDMPLINSHLIIRLQNFANMNNQACYFEHNHLPCIIPVTDSVKAYIEEQLTHSGNYSVRGLLKFVNAASITNTERLPLMNTNTPEEWMLACQANYDNRKENRYVRSQC